VASEAHRPPRFAVNLAGTRTKWRTKIFRGCNAVTEQEQIIAIAEVCEWKLSEPIFGHDGRWSRRAYKDDGYSHVQINSSWAGEPCDVIDDWSNVPDYIHDLNAMHEVESVIGTDIKWTRKYIGILRVKGNMDGVRATSAQRAEAFLRAIGKWKETP
jgi:hypothetical protein